MNWLFPQKPLVWLDLEMSGLNPTTDHILELALLFTDDELNIIHEGMQWVFHESDTFLDNMNNWCKIQHAKSGLTAAVKHSTLTLESALPEILDFITTHCAPQTGVLCGNSIHQDKAFLHRWAPALYDYFNYRIIDVSSVKELIQRWYPKNSAIYFKKSDGHRAYTDIRESIAELKHYRTHFFK